ncbi:hypothetical protein ACJ8RE_003110 [Acinetobacter baumannii]|uniref:hypothetical protein n=1 Tax=Acinetobacter baumannii TaxID=470 RepID=UPI002ACE182B|nr:hypothetical protein [Acinetobacter baumannii]WQI58935.1 hypothetical protein U2S75_19300 [Acinetobacter baumannii]
MGKKSRLKKERRLAKQQAQNTLNFPEGIHPIEKMFDMESFHNLFSSGSYDFKNPTIETNKEDLEFLTLKDNICSLFRKYSFNDVYQSLTISDLWLPNISSMLKHCLAMYCFVSIETKDFKQNDQISSYDDFKVFIKHLYKLLPNNPMVEDFIPEVDWGEIKYQWTDKQYKILYGGPVERITDFIDAFRLSHSTDSNALLQLEQSLKLQSHLINSISSNNFDESIKIRPGTLFLPDEQFWLESRKTISEINKYINSSGYVIDSNLVCSLNSINQFDSNYAFCDAFMQGMGLPYSFIKNDESFFPLSIRNMPSVIIDHYDTSCDLSTLNQQLNTYINSRFQIDFPFIFKVENSTKNPSVLDYEFFSVWSFGEKIIFFTAFDRNNLESLISLEKNIQRYIDSAEWNLRSIENKFGMRIENSKKVQPRFKDIQIVAVSNHVSTVNGFMGFKSQPCSMVFDLATFCTVFDSLDTQEEFIQFIEFNKQNKNKVFGFNSLNDSFFAFRNTHSVLEQGAVTYHSVMLDPHTGSNGRFGYLKEYWLNMPKYMPTDWSKWDFRNEYQGNIKLYAKNHIAMSWSTEILNCSIHCYSDFKTLIKEQREQSANINELFLECLCDAISQRKDLLKDSFLVDFSRITFHISPDPRSYLELEEMSPLGKQEIITSARLLEYKENDEQNLLAIQLLINLKAFCQLVESASGANAQVDILINVLEKIAEITKSSIESKIINELNETRKWPKRVQLTHETQPFDSHNTKPIEPTNTQYLHARKQLALLFKSNNIEPGRYELTTAKEIINVISDQYKNLIYEKIYNLDYDLLLKFSLANHDAYVSDNYIQHTRLKLSLQHEVTYDREERFTEIKKEFIRNSKNYRYLIEAIKSSENKNNKQFSEDLALDLIAYIDWLLVLYEASDTLHNDIEVGGLNIDSEYIPEIFYSSERKDTEINFHNEQANYHLSREGVSSEDEVTSSLFDGNFDPIDKVFQTDLSFKFSQLLTILDILSNWASYTKIAPQPIYQDSFENIEKKCNEILVDIDLDEIRKILSFLTLDGSKVKRLLGKDTLEFDVPVSDHNKREHRLNIRPIIELADGNLIWGPAACHRTLTIWFNHIANGYLPADFNWKSVNNYVRKLKEGVEKELEIRAGEVTKRFIKLTERGIDLRRRFPKEDIPDIGDFDVLAYIPEKNIWINLECKYNKPYYCLKDMKRLRNTVFLGEGTKQSHVSKIQKRAEYLENNLEYVRGLLKWPESSCQRSPQILNLYISINTYWWFRNPPIQVDINFIQIDALDNWFQMTLAE